MEDEISLEIEQLNNPFAQHEPEATVRSRSDEEATHGLFLRSDADDSGVQSTVLLQEAQAPSTSEDVHMSRKEAVHAVPQENTSGAPSSTCGLLSIETYKPYFDVDTDVVVSRVTASLVPYRSAFYKTVLRRELTDDDALKCDSEEAIHPEDLYGPLWMTITLCMTFGVASTLGRGGGDANLVLVAEEAFILLFCQLLVVPTLIRIATSTVPFIKLISAYGYAQASWMIVAMSCAVPSTLWRILMLCYGILVSTLAFVRSFEGHPPNPVLGLIILGVAGASELLVAILVGMAMS